MQIKAHFRHVATWIATKRVMAIAWSVVFSVVYLRHAAVDPYSKPLRIAWLAVVSRTAVIEALE
jgi:hypothetical protein